MSPLSFFVLENEEKIRIDRLLSKQFPDFSRVQWVKSIKKCTIQVNGKFPEPSDKVFKNDCVSVLAFPERDEDEDEEIKEENIDFSIVDCTSDYIIINKPHGLVVHPGAGFRSGTLINGLVYRYPELKKLPRAGLVHRLDKDTSGLMIVAREERAYQFFLHQMKEKKIQKQYKAIVWGEFLKPLLIDKSIGRHPVHRTKMAVHSRGKASLTVCSPIQVSPCHRVSLISCQIETGRTHQIRVHLSYHSFPIVGDGLYSPRHLFQRSPIKRQCLHAEKLSFCSPSGHFLRYSLDLPNDIKSTLDFYKFS